MSFRLAPRGWLLAAVLLTACKLWLTSGQTIFAIGPAFHDDRLFANLAAHLINGDWLGPYNHYTLAKGPMLPLFIAGAFWIGLPLMLAQQLFYAAACAAVTRSLAPWLSRPAWQFGLYTLLLWNPMSFDAGNLSRLMRQNVYTPLALLTIAGLIVLFHRRRECWRRQIGPAAGTGLSLGCFWLTREESVWLLPAVGLLLVAPALALGRELRSLWRPVATAWGTLLLAACLPLASVATQNLRHYSWFGTVEFQASAFKDAYGALTRLQVGPVLPQVPVTREMREAAYAASPAFARLRPYLEGPVGDHWSEKNLFPAADRQMRGGWFVWALRDAVAAAGLAPDAGTALRFYRQVADEVNAACDRGLVPARPRRSGFAPVLRPDLTRPLLTEAATYGRYFLGFSGFTAYSPDSVGDYAELKAFRDVVGTRLSHAPRSPEPVHPLQAARDTRKVELLDDLGQWLGRLYAWIGPLLLLVGVVRGLESLQDRRVSFLLGLAAALLAATAAYLAINVLVQVTSFYNMSPAAMASAYPLYLIALVAIAFEAGRAWIRRAPAAVPITARATARPSIWAWLVPVGAAVAVLGARLAEIRFFGSDVPYNDQWYIEAAQIISPWLDGTLRLRDFFAPHFEHLPVWTRFLAWLQVAITGRWDPLVQMTINAVLHAGFIGLVAAWASRQLPPVGAGLVSLVLVLGGSLPHAWENIAWGFQSQFPLALIFLFVHVHGTCSLVPGSKRWWLAQAAGLAGLGTLASMWLAPLAVLASWLWTGPRWRRDLLPGLLIAVLGAGLLAVIHLQMQSEGSLAQVARSPLGLLHGSLHLLGWPSILPGAVAIVQLPWLIHALRLRGQGAAVAPLDRIVFVLGLWSFLQAIALAFARTGDTNDFVSRYGELLFVGVLAGAVALYRLVPRGGRLRPLYLALATVWSLLVAAGLVRNSTEGHAHYFHLNAAANADLRRTAIQRYLLAGDRSLLETPATRWVLAQEPSLVTGLLDKPKFRAVLPASVNPASPPVAAGVWARWIQARCWALLIAGASLGAIGLAGLALRPPTGPSLPLLPAAPDPWRWRLSAAVGLAALALMTTWANPFAFNRAQRWQQLLGGEHALSGLTFSFVGPSPFGSERLQGAAPLQPETLRNQFFGTAPAGPELTCTVVSSAFRLTTPWLIVPYAGYPVGHGNGLRLQLLDESGQHITEEIGCNGPNLEEVGFWIADVGAHPKRLARLVLYDGRTDTEAWLAVAPPIPTQDPGQVESLIRGMQNERHAASHAALAVISVIALICAIVSGWSHRRGRT